MAQKPKEPVETIESTPGKADYYSTGPRRGLMWTVRWEKAQITGTQSKISMGQMTGVSGSTFKNNRVVSKFSATEGKVDERRNMLLLNRNVVVQSLDEKTTLYCDSLVYDGVSRLITAKGSVRVRGHGGALGTFSELVATQDLKQVATPDLFDKK